MTEQVKKRRSLVTYAFGIANSTGQSNKVAARKALPVFYSLKKDAHSAALNSPSTGPANWRRYERSPQEIALWSRCLSHRATDSWRSHTRFCAIEKMRKTRWKRRFLSAYRHWPSFEGRSAPRTWFARIVLNTALMIQHKRKRRLSTIHPLPENSNSREVNWTENLLGSEPDPEMIHAEQETLQLIDWIVGKLKPALRQALTMTCFDELSGSEASAMLGVSTGTFKARLFRAKRQVLAKTGRALGAPIHKKNPSSEFVKRK
jgi:RNA polymerase sigma factor (sigma-70 family)